MAAREPLWQGALGVVLGLGSILFGLTPRPALPYAPGDVRATPEFGLAFAVVFVALGAFAVAVFAVRLIQGVRGPQVGEVAVSGWGPVERVSSRRLAATVGASVARSCLSGLAQQSTRCRAAGLTAVGTRKSPPPSSGWRHRSAGFGVRGIRRLVLLVSVLLLAACSPAPGPHPSAPSADDLANRQVVARGANSITLLPASPKGAVLGVEYDYTMPHCSMLGPVDVDGSFWDAKPGDGSGVDGMPGVFRLVTPNDAQFTTDKGASFGLTRHDGAKQFTICS